MKRLALGLALVMAALAQAPAAQAEMNIGNYEVHWSRPWDFHTYIVEFTPCYEPTGRDTIPGCRKASMNPRPIAKATQWYSEAHLIDGRWVLEVDNAFGLSCGGYYGPSVPTRDVYTWDDVTLGGTMTSSYAHGPCGEPAGSVTYPFSFVRY
ncbi:hypothetical protein ACN27E_00640 [Mycobacterium sp. WMMD1722]|uniref:hypothetical protein n=1 Tax=Mycobacterium sp. WMMD1722 TaxID=3404117 RepID=UPI003BF513CE